MHVQGTEDEASIQAMFNEWRLSFNKTYPSTTAYTTALANFKDNMKRAAAINANTAVSYWSDLNSE